MELSKAFATICCIVDCLNPEVSVVHLFVAENELLFGIFWSLLVNEVETCHDFDRTQEQSKLVKLRKACSYVQASRRELFVAHGSV